MIEKKNILILSPDSVKGSMGGLGVHLREILMRIDTDRYNVDVVCFGGKTETLRDGVEIMSVRSEAVSTVGIQGGSGILSLMSAQTELTLGAVSFIEKRKPNVIYCMDWSTAVASMSLAEHYGLPMIFAVHLGIDSEYSKHYFNQSEYDYAANVEASACNYADRIIHVSESYLNSFPFSVFRGKSCVIPNGVDVDMFKKAEMWENKKPEILFIGRLAYMKQPKLLLDIDLRGCRLAFAGGGSGCDDNIIESIRKASRERDDVTYYGKVYGQRKVDIMANADLIVMPSMHEPFGMVALEALAAGSNGRTLLASSFVGGMGEFLDENCALNCGITKESLQVCIDRFLAMTDDEKNKMRNNGVLVAERYTWENTADLITKQIDYATGY